MTMIQLFNIVKHYDKGRTRALDGVSCRIEKGEIVALMGPSGAGKSTLLSILGTIDRPTRGVMKIDGRSWEQLAPHHRFRARYVGFVFQFHHLLSHLTALENIEIPMYCCELSRSARQRKARALIDAVGLGPKASVFPNKLSGGERQRIAVARALANDPQIILADEPTGSVDTTTGEQILHLMIDHCRQRNLTMVVATHNPSVSDLADRCLVIKNGRFT
jgi:ABC-type lipoprotein export system ATPase subunit